MPQLSWTMADCLSRHSSTTIPSRVKRIPQYWNQRMDSPSTIIIAKKNVKGRIKGRISLMDQIDRAAKLDTPGTGHIYVIPWRRWQPTFPTASDNTWKSTRDPPGNLIRAATEAGA